ncbi:MAG TPA: helix-turn-helix domain-containing protein [Candidatus Saccharimonadales bacterium]|nr:helix-turn-helix domain-containing protein [Candidatus Saccharimonadales bacterium]
MQKTITPTGTCPPYGRQCIAVAADIISSKWTPQLIYALSCGVQRFCGLQKEVGGVNPRTLSARLDELERSGIIEKVSYPEVPPRVEYSLTDKGQELVPILQTMLTWGDKYCDEP